MTSAGIFRLHDTFTNKSFIAYSDNISNWVNKFYHDYQAIYGQKLYNEIKPVNLKGIKDYRYMSRYRIQILDKYGTKKDLSKWISFFNSKYPIGYNKDGEEVIDLKLINPHYKLFTFWDNEQDETRNAVDKIVYCIYYDDNEKPYTYIGYSTQRNQYQVLYNFKTNIVLTKYYTNDLDINRLKIIVLWRSSAATLEQLQGTVDEYRFQYHKGGAIDFPKRELPKAKTGKEIKAINAATLQTKFYPSIAEVAREYEVDVAAVYKWLRLGEVFHGWLWIKDKEPNYNQRYKVYCGDTIEGKYIESGDYKDFGYSKTEFAKQRNRKRIKIKYMEVGYKRRLDNEE